MKKKLVFLSITIFLALVVSVGAYAYTYSTDVTTIGVAIAGEEIATSAPAPAPNQPVWYEMLPQPEYDQEILRPDAGGDETTIPSQFPNSGAHWEKVDDISPDDYGTYVYSTTKNERRDLYNLSNHAQGFGVVDGVTVFFNFSGGTGGGDIGYARAAIKTNGVVYEGATESQAGSTFTVRSYTWTTNPNTGQAWTWNEIDALQAGLVLFKEANGTTASCTQVYVLVDFEMPPILEGEVPSGELYTVTPTDNYTGDLMVKVYLTNTGPLSLALKYLNMKLYVAGSIEADKTPDYQLLTFENGVATFNIQQDGSPESYTVEVVGGSYRLVSGDANDWVEGWTVVPEFYIEVTQRGIL